MDNPSQPIFNTNQNNNLPNATAVLVLGIISIVGFCCCWGIVGLTCGIISLVLAKKDLALYNASPAEYTRVSYNNLKSGRICAIVGIILSCIVVLVAVVVIAIYGVSILSNPGAIRSALNQ